MNAPTRFAGMLSGLVVLLALSGCAEPRLDASSQERVLASTATLRAKLSGEDLVEFDSLMSEAIASTTQTNKKQSLVDALIIYNGMTGPEIVGKHRKLREERVSAQATRDRDLLSRMREIKDQISELKKVHISDVSFQEASDDIVWMRVAINNGLPYTIASVKAHWELRTRGRELAWTSGETTFHVSGGIESGESVRAHTSQGWEHIVARKRKEEHPEAEFTFFVLQVVQADGTAVPILDGISDEDWKRFAEVESKNGAEQADSNSQTRKE